MKTDRELLELAAKAAGFKTTQWQDLSGWGEVRYGLSEAIWTGDDYWNPLVDDGDAFRLAMRMNFDIQQTGAFLVEAGYRHENGEEQLALEYFADGDRARACRRAIVRASTGDFDPVE